LFDFSVVERTVNARKSWIDVIEEEEKAASGSSNVTGPTPSKELGKILDKFCMETPSKDVTLTISLDSVPKIAPIKFDVDLPVALKDVKTEMNTPPKCLEQERNSTTAPVVFESAVKTEMASPRGLESTEKSLKNEVIFETSCETESLGKQTFGKNKVNIKPVSASPRSR